MRDRETLRAKPLDTRKMFQQALLCQRRGTLDEAARLYAAVLKAEPSHHGAMINLGLVYLGAGKADAAARVLRKAIYQKPNSPEAHNNLGLALQGLNRWDDAVGHLRKAVALKPDYPEAQNNLGNALLTLDRPAEAVGPLGRALASLPDHAEAHLYLGRALAQSNRQAEALPHLAKAAALRPALGGESNNYRALALKELGRLDEARRAIETAIELDPAKLGNYAILASIKRFSADDPHLPVMAAFHRDTTIAADDRIYLEFALGKAYSDIGDIERSFRHLLAGNALKRQQTSYSEADTLAELARSRADFTVERLREQRGLGNPSSVPVFILGMPRSGSTLVEQILASHPKVHGAGELSDFDDEVRRWRGQGDAAAVAGAALAGLGTGYVERLRVRAPAAERITDKMPVNFKYAGLIHLALPNARIIHTLRDPVDTCLSAFSIHFNGVAQPYSYDLGELGRYHRAYEELMAHWRAVLPPGVMLELHYEELVVDLEGQARRIVAHCGLDWDDTCLSFHRTQRPVTTASATQVRQPIYRSSVGRWRPYEHLLAPLLDALGRQERGASPPETP